MEDSIVAGGYASCISANGYTSITRSHGVWMSFIVEENANIYAQSDGDFFKVCRLDLVDTDAPVKVLLRHASHTGKRFYFDALFLTQFFNFL